MIQIRTSPLVCPVYTVELAYCELAGGTRISTLYPKYAISKEPKFSQEFKTNLNLRTFTCTCMFETLSATQKALRTS